MQAWRVPGVCVGGGWGVWGALGCARTHAQRMQAHARKQADKQADRAPVHTRSQPAPTPHSPCCARRSFNVVSEEASGKKTVVYQSPSAPAQFDVNSLADLNDLR